MSITMKKNKIEHFIILSVVLFFFSMPVYGETIEQVTYGWCSPNIANVTGDVSIICVGVAPKALQKLNENLNQLRAKYDTAIEELVAKADRWTRHYNELREMPLHTANRPKELEEIDHYILDGELDKALAGINEKMAQRHKESGYLAELYYMRGNVHFLNLTFEKAIAQFEIAYELYPSNPKYLFAYSDTLIQNGQELKAETELNKMLPHLRKLSTSGSVEDHIWIFRAMDLLGLIYVNRSDHANLERISRETFDILNDMANAPTADQQYETSGVISTITFSLGRNYLTVGKLNAAEKFLGSAFGFALYACEKLNASYCITTAMSATLSAVCDMRKKNYDRAIKRFQLALDTMAMMNIDTSVKNEFKVGTLIQKADCHLFVGEKKAARDCWLATLNIYNSGQVFGDSHKAYIAHAYTKLGEFLSIEGKRPEAESHFQKALSLTSNSALTAAETEKALAMVNLGSLYAIQQKFANALYYCDQAITIFRKHWLSAPDDYKDFYARSLFVSGNTYLLIGNKNKGCDNLSKVYAVAPDGKWSNLITKVYSTSCQ